MSRTLPQPRSRFVPALALAGAVVLAVGLFLVIPLTQALNQAPADLVSYREMVLAAPPPPPEMPPPPEEQTPERVRKDPEPPRLEQEVMEVRVQQLPLSLSPGMGVALTMGVPAMPRVEKMDTIAQIEELLSFDDLDQMPSVLNPLGIPAGLQRRLRLRGVKRLETVVKLRVDRRGRSEFIALLSTSHEVPGLEEELARMVSQFRWTVPRKGGIPVDVPNGTMPIVLAP